MKKAESLAREIFSDESLEEISQAIKTFESQTSGEIVISFNTSSHKQPYKATRRIFEKAKLHETKERNATLIALFLVEHKFAIYRDVGIHEKVPADFWETTIAEMKNHFAEGRMQEGLLHGINELGNNLAKYFPVSDDDVNELSDQINFEDSSSE